MNAQATAFKVSIAASLALSVGSVRLSAQVPLDQSLNLPPTCELGWGAGSNDFPPLCESLPVAPSCASRFYDASRPTVTIAVEGGVTSGFLGAAWMNSTSEAKREGALDVLDFWNYSLRKKDVSVIDCLARPGGSGFSLGIDVQGSDCSGILPPPTLVGVPPLLGLDAAGNVRLSPIEAFMEVSSLREREHKASRRLVQCGNPPEYAQAWEQRETTRTAVSSAFAVWQIEIGAEGGLPLSFSFCDNAEREFERSCIGDDTESAPVAQDLPPFAREVLVFGRNLSSGQQVIVTRSGAQPPELFPAITATCSSGTGIRYDFLAAPGVWRFVLQGGVVPQESLLRTMSSQASGCIADIANTDGEYFPDGVVDNGDFQAFFAAFFLASGGQAPESTALQCLSLIIVDIANTDGEPGADGRVDGGDFSAFFSSFFACQLP